LRALRWAREGRPAPAPPHVKQLIVADLARAHRPRAFVETGTYRGDTLAVIAPLVDRAISIELDATLASLARRRFSASPSVEILMGDSADVLPGVVASLDGPALFWLDGHFSGGPTADSHVPVLAELDAVLASPLDHVILIDDIRLFDGSNGYPNVETIRDRILARRPTWAFEVVDDIARAHAPTGA
jgi:hypothetical protein